MAGANNKNVVEYEFHGNTLNLQKAIKLVAGLLNASIENLKKYQESGITEAQKYQLSVTKKLFDSMQAAAEKGKKLTQAEVKQVIAAGREVLKSAESLYKTSLRARDRASKSSLEIANKEASKQERIAKDTAYKTGIAYQTNASQHADFLQATSSSLRQFLSDEAFTDIQNTVKDFRAAQEEFKAGKITEEQLATATDQLQSSYRLYSETLKNVKNTQASANRAIKSAADMVRQFRAQLELALSSFAFWMQMIRKVIQLAKEGITYMADYVESLNFLEVALGGVNEEFSNFIQLQQLALGLDPTDINTAAASFLAFGNSIGFAGDQSEVFSMNMTQLATDLASLYNTDVETMMKKLRSGLSGQTRALQQYGISVHDATIEEWLLSKGHKVSMNNLSESSQAYARYLYILEKTTNAQGDLARTLESPANQIKILKTQIKLLTQNFGSLISVVIIPLIRLLNMILQPLNAFLMALTSMSAENFTSALTEIDDDAEGAADSIDNLKSHLTGLDEINQTSSGAGADVGGMLGVEDWLLDMGGTKLYDNLVGSIQPLIDIFQRLGETIAPVFALLQQPLDIVLDSLGMLLDTLSFLLVPVEWLLTGLSWLLTNIVGPILAFIKAFISNIWLLIGAFVALNLIQLAYTGSLQSMLIVKVATFFITSAKAIWTNVSALLANIAATIKQKIASLALGLMLWWETAAWWQKAIAVIAAAGVLALVVGGIVLAATASASNSANSALGQETAPPALATGGVVSAPTLALVGEGKYNEAVVPLGNSPQFTSMKEEIALEVSRLGGAGNGRGSGSSQPIILNIDGREIARALWPSLSATYNQVGVKLR